MSFSFPSTDIRQKNLTVEKNLIASQIYTNNLIIRGQKFSDIVNLAMGEAKFSGTIEGDLKVSTDTDGGGITIVNSPSNTSYLTFSNNVDGKLWSIRVNANDHSFNIVNEQTDTVCMSIDLDTNVVDFPQNVSLDGYPLLNGTFDPDASRAYTESNLNTLVGNMVAFTMSTHNVCQLSKTVLVSGSMTFECKNDRTNFYTTLNTAPIYEEGWNVSTISGTTSFYNSTATIGCSATISNSGDPAIPLFHIVTTGGNLNGVITMNYILHILLS